MIHNILKALSFILIFTYSSVANAQFGMWARSFSGSYNDFTYDIVVDAWGNSYTIGTFYGTMDFDPGPGTYTLNAAVVEDVFILKLNASGNFVWVKRFEGSGKEEIYSIAIDSQNNIYTCGTFDGSYIDLDPGPATYTVNNDGGADMYISKLDSLGNFVFGKKIGGSGHEIANGINLDTFDNVYLTGSYSSLNVDFDPGLGTYLLSNSNMTLSSGYVVKLNTVGDFIWAKKTVGGGTGNKIALDASGNVYSSGIFNGISDDFDPGIGTYTMSTYGSWDIYLSKLDSAGNFIWAKQIGGASQDYAVSFKMGANNDIYVFGNLINPLDLDPGPALYNLTSTGGSDGFIAKLDSNGNFNWAEQITGPSSQQFTDIEIDAMNNIYLFGTFSGLTDLDPTTGTYTVNASTDIFITKIDAVGNFIWAQRIGETTNTGGISAVAIALDPYNNIYASGQLVGTVDFDPTVNTNIINASMSNFDAFVCKLILPCTVPSPPTQIINTANSIHCNNQSNTLTATSTGIVTWHSAPGSTVALGVGNNFVTPILAQGIYTYYAQSNSCTKNTNRTALTLTVNPYPSLTITSNDSILCAGQQAILQCNGANSFLWSTLSPAGQITVSPTVTTTYSVIGTAASGCSNTASYTQSVTVCNGIAVNNINDSHIKIFPNPGAGLFNIKGNIEGEIEIFNALGQRIYCQKIATETFVIDLGEFSDGIYFIKIKNESNEKCVKIIKQQ